MKPIHRRTAIAALAAVALAGAGCAPLLIGGAVTGAVVVAAPWSGWSCRAGASSAPGGPSGTGSLDVPGPFPAATVDGSATTTIKGGMVKIN